MRLPSSHHRGHQDDRDGERKRDAQNQKKRNGHANCLLSCRARVARSVSRSGGRQEHKHSEQDQAFHGISFCCMRASPGNQDGAVGAGQM